MKFPQPISVKDLAKRYNLEIYGDSSLLAQGINVIHRVQPGDITFVDIPKYFQKSLNSPATVILINQKIDCPPGKVLLINDDPFEVYNDLVKQHRPFQFSRDDIDPTAQIGVSSIIEPGAIIGAHVVIGDQCYVQGNTYIGPYTQIGNRVNIQSGALIGTDAFYFKHDQDGYTKWHTGGRVLIQDQVEIAAGCTVNRGVSSDTQIGFGTKIDCQVHVGHGAIIGKHCLIAAQSGISGKVKIGDHVVIYGQVGIAQNITIGDRVIILAKSGVSKDLQPDKVYFGYPAAEVMTKNRELAALRNLPEFMKSFKAR